MINIYPILQQIKEVLEPLNFKSLKIGLEKGADKSINCPLCRIIVEEEIDKGILSDLVVQIVIGLDVKNDYEALYNKFFELNYKVKLALFKLPYKIELLNTITDEDRLNSIKAGIIRVKIRDLNEDWNKAYWRNF